MTGKTIAHYQVLEPLGAGGMGAVYKARDTHLNRFVAIKFLAAEATANPDRRQRFIQEAQAASALNHPNIITIHDINRNDGVDYMVMEMVEGRTLASSIGASSIGGRALVLPDLLRYAVQIADALAAAHAAGILHRDLKPANIMVTAKGLVKVLDFGLAKLLPPAEEGGALTASLALQTEAGTILGTAAYMSPEQAEGKPLDARTDIFSFGAVLYEMACGTRAFQRDSKVATLSAVLREEAKPLSGVPQDLERIITRCLRKDLARRFQTMLDVRAELEDLREDSGSGTAALPSPPAARRAAWWPLLVLALTAAVATGWYFLRPQPKPAAPPQILPITTYPGSERTPTLSPDGNQVAFSWNGERQDNFDIYVKLLSGGPPLRLTTDPLPDIAPAWSPDGRHIAFSRSGQGVFLISPLGGPERRITETAATYLAWTPDSQSLALCNAGDPGIRLIPVETGEPRQLTAHPPGQWGDLNVSFSADGRQFAFGRHVSSTAADVYVAAVAGGEPRRLTHNENPVHGLTWMPDSREIIYSSGPVFGAHALWKADASGARPPKVIVGAESNLRFPVHSRSSPARLVCERVSEDFNIWKAGSGATKPAPIIASTQNDSSPRFSPDGKQIAFGSNRSGSMEIWSAAADGSGQVQLTSFKNAYCNAPRWSPDGRRIVFAAQIAGNRDIYVIGAGGGAVQRLTSDPAQEGRPSWSQDGRSIYFYAQRPDMEIWRMPATGGPGRRLTGPGGHEAFESLDGTRVYFAKLRSAGVWSVPIDGGEESLVIEDASYGWWALGDAGVYYVDVRGARDDKIRPVMLFDPATGARKQVGSIEGRINPGGSDFDVSRDGRSIVWGRLDQINSDLVVLENVQ